MPKITDELADVPLLLTLMQLFGQQEFSNGENVSLSLTFWVQFSLPRLK